MRSAVCPPAVQSPHFLFANKPPPPPSPVGVAPGGSAVALSQDDMKRVAAFRAVELVESGMVLGLGTGSTAVHAVERLGDLLRRGVLRDVVGVPTSLKTAAHANAVGVPLVDLNDHPIIDLSIDGADEVDSEFNLVKGRGGSLLREKMIEGASRRFVVIVDETKLVPCLGASGAIPVEVVPFGWNYTLRQLERLFEKEPGFSARLRTVSNGDPFLTDNSNYIIELFFEKGIGGDLTAASDAMLKITGVVEHGMFLGMATSVIIAGKDGVVKVLNK